MAQEHHEEFLRLFGEKLDEGGKYYQPLEVMGLPEDIAHCAVYLASDEARFVTGQNIVVDGGLTTHLSPFASENARRRNADPWDEIVAWIKAHKKSE